MPRQRSSSKKRRQKRVLGELLKPEHVQWIETKIAAKGWNKEEFYAAYKTANAGKPLAQDPKRQLQRIFKGTNPLTPLGKANLATTLGITIDDFDAGLRDSIAARSVHPDDDKKRAAERRWQYIQTHPIRGVEILFILKASVGVDWFREVLNETRLNFSRDEPSFKIGQLFAVSPPPNTKEPSPKIEKAICSYWEIYEAEKGVWFKKISPDERVFSTVAGFDATAHWSALGVKNIERLQDLGLLTEVGVSIPARAYQVGVEEFELRFLGDTFSFSVSLSEHGLMSFLHEMASTQHMVAKDAEPIPIGTSFGGIQLLDMFYRQLLPRAKDESRKSRGGIAGMSGPNGKAISFYPSMPIGYTKTQDSKEYTFKVTVPGKVDTVSRIKKLEEKLKIDPADAKSYAELAAVFSHEGRLGDAIRCLETGIERAPPDADVFGIMAETLSKMGRFNEALALYQKAEKLTSKADTRLTSAVQNGLGVCLHELDRDDEALRHFQSAAVIEPSKASYQFNLSMAFAVSQRYAEALAPAQRALELEPNDHRAAMHIGVLLTIEDRTLEAIPYFEKATQLAPKSADAHELLGQFLAKTDQHDRAILSLQQAVKIKGSARRYELLGGSFASLNRWPEAEAAFRRGTELEPTNSAMLANLGASLANQDRLAEALQCFERAVSADPSNLDAQQKLTAMQDLTKPRIPPKS